MMFDFEKALNTILYITNALGSSGFHKLFKIMYFAEREHLALYGSPILADEFISMNHGPVPSKVYDILKAVRNGNGIPVQEEAKELVVNSITVINNHYVKAKVDADRDYLSETEIATLDKYIEYCRPMDFGRLSELSHDSAWEKGQMYNVMSTYDIAEAGGADEAMISYIRSISENESALSGCPF